MQIDDVKLFDACCMAPSALPAAKSWPTRVCGLSGWKGRLRGPMPLQELLRLQRRVTQTTSIQRLQGWTKMSMMLIEIARLTALHPKQEPLSQEVSPADSRSRRLRHVLQPLERAAAAAAAATWPCRRRADPSSALSAASQSLCCSGREIAPVQRPPPLQPAVPSPGGTFG